MKAPIREVSQNFMPQIAHSNYFTYLLRNDRPDAMAWMEGNNKNKNIKGVVKFYSVPSGGVLVEVEVTGLPDHYDGEGSGFYAFNIHEKGDCGNNFEDTGNHYNPEGVPHPLHAGDMPTLMATNGYSWMAFYDGRLSVREIIGKSVIIHERADDFTTQPSGNAGNKIACGVVRAARQR